MICVHKYIMCTQCTQCTQLYSSRQWGRGGCSWGWVLDLIILLIKKGVSARIGIKLYNRNMSSVIMLRHIINLSLKGFSDNFQIVSKTSELVDSVFYIYDLYHNW